MALPATEPSEAAGSGPTQLNYEEAGERWRDRKTSAVAVRVAILVAPIAMSFATSYLASRYLPHSRIGINRWAWWGLVIIVATVVMLVTERFARRFLPLAALLKLSLVFPDEAPNRFRAAMRTGTARQLQRRLADTSDIDERDSGEYLLDLLAALAEHDRLTRGHSTRVRAYADMIAEEMGLSRSDCEKLHWAALLHDVGKLEVPPEILNKEGRPTDEEFAVIKAHPAAGLAYVEPLREWLGDWLHALDQHHERWDGRGYPSGLAGDQMHLAGRIVAVADAFDVITSARSYKKPLPAALARQEISDCAGSQFDPTVVRAFLNVGLGRLRLAVGPLAWLNSFPTVADSALLPAAGTVVSAGATVAVAAVANVVGLWPATIDADEPPPVLAFDSESAGPDLGVDDLDLSLSEGESVEFLLTGSAAEEVTIRIVTPPEHGAAVLVGVTAATDEVFTQSVHYTPEAGFVGTDRITIEACDATACERAEIIFRVDPIGAPPAPGRDSVELRSSETQRLALASWLANDNDPDGDPLTITDVSAGLGITAALDGDFVVITAADDFAGTTIISYTVCDPDGRCEAGMVTVEVLPARSPEAGADFVVGTEDTSGSVPRARLLANDTDADGDDLAIVEVAGGPGLVVAMNADHVAYSPAPNRSGPTTFTYVVCDPSDRCDTATVTVTLTATPDRPVAGNDEIDTEVDTAGVVSSSFLLFNDTDADDDDLELTAIADLGNLTATLGDDGLISYTPDPGFVGAASFSYTVCDPGGLCDSGAVTVAVESTNERPTAVDDGGLAFATLEDTPFVTGDVTANDTDDRPLDSATITVESTPANGSLLDNGDGTFSYDPDPDFNGSDSFTYTVTDASGLVSDPATVTIGIASVNDAPVAVGDDGLAFTTVEDLTFTTGDVTANDSDIDHPVGSLLVRVTGSPTNGAIVANGDGTFSYTPDPDFSGVDTFTYILEDGEGTVSGPATVTIVVVSDPDDPVAADDAGAGYTTTEDTGLTTPDVTANDGDTDDAVDPTTAIVAGAPANGSVVANGDGTFTYTPDPDFFGSDTFTYTIEDPGGGVSNAATVTIVVTPVNDEPTFSPGTPVSVLEDSGAVTVSGWATAIDPGGSESGQTLSFDVTNDNNALFAVQPAVDPATGDLTFTPAADANGSATVDTVLRDDGGTADGGDDRSPTHAFALSVGAVNDAPTFSDGGDPPAVLEDAGAQTVSGWATAVSVGPADEAGQTPTFNLTANTNPGLFSVGPDLDEASGDLTFTPADDASGSATLTFTLSDDGGTANGGADTSADHTVTITVTDESDPPTIDTNVTPVIAPLSSITLAPTDLAASDNDNPATDLTFTITAGPTEGTIKRLGVIVSAFTQDDIDNGRIVYEHTGGVLDSETLDFDLDDGTGSGTVSSQFKIGFTPTGVVLSEFRTNGPAGGTDEFIEIYNSGAAGVDLDGWQFRVTGVLNFDFYTFPAVVLEPGQHFLVSHDSGPLAGTADDTWSGLDYGTWGDIVLKDDTGANVDIVGFDSGSNPILFEGTKLPSYPGAGADVSYERAVGGASANCVDTNNNLADWFLNGAANPQTQSDPKVAC